MSVFVDSSNPKLPITNHYCPGNRSTINHGGHGKHSESRFRDKICYVEQDLMRILRCVRSVRCGILTHRYISTTASKSKSLQKKISKAPVNVKVIDAARVKGSYNYPRFYSGQR